MLAFWCTHNRLAPHALLIGSPFRLGGVSGGYQTIDPSPSGSDKDGEIATGLGLPDEAVIALAGSCTEWLAGDQLLDLFNADTVAGDMLLTSWLDNKLIDLHSKRLFQSLL